MRKILVFIFLVLIKKETQAQLVTVFESDTLNIYTNKNGENINPSVCLLKFGAWFNDSVVVYLNNKRVFSKFLRRDSLSSADEDLTAPYIKIPSKNKNSELKISLINEKITIKTKLIIGYRYLYVSKQYKLIELSYKNEEVISL